VETIRSLHQSALVAIEEQLKDEEQVLVGEIVAGLEGDSDQLRDKLDELDDLMYQSDRKIQYLPDLTEFLCAIAHWLDYRGSGNPAYIAAIGLNMINSIDYAVSGQVDGYSMSDLLAASQMAQEVERQQVLLKA
jgi:hypothetical protein